MFYKGVYLYYEPPISSGIEGFSGTRVNTARLSHVRTFGRIAPQYAALLCHSLTITVSIHVRDV